MRDPHERLTSRGTIETGAARERIPPTFAPVVEAAIAGFHALAATGVADADACLLLYGSVATGQARVGSSDVDLLALGIAPSAAVGLAASLSTRFADVCRGVEIGVAGSRDHLGPGDEAHGLRVFLRHYCVLLAGRDPVAGEPQHAGDARAARGFAGDTVAALDRWRAEERDGTDPAGLRRRIARKSLLTAAALAGVADGIWTTDRAEGARRWGLHRPDLAGDLLQLLAWADADAGAGASADAGAVTGAGAVTDAGGGGGGARGASPAGAREDGDADGDPGAARGATAEDIRELLRRGGIVDRIIDDLRAVVGLSDPAG